MRIDIITLFPKMFIGPFQESIIKKAQQKGLVEINIHNLRDWAKDRHKTVDDRPFGGGVGMILRVDVIDQAFKELIGKTGRSDTKIILLDPAGKKFTQTMAKRLSKENHLILIAGHYEGVDYRVHKYIADEVISIGDYILTGGEIPAMVLVDAIVRLIPNVLEKEEATKLESFSKLKIQGSSITTLEFPQYTRPAIYRNWKVPKVLLSGDHQKIEKWRKDQALKRTQKIRPSLIKTLVK